MERNSCKVLWKETLANFHGKKLKERFMERDCGKYSWKETQAKFYGKEL